MVRCIDQTIWGSNCGEGVDADCFRGALASLLEFPISKVPHFVALYGKSHWQELDKWLRNLGLQTIHVAFHKPNREIAQAFSDIPCILVVGDPESDDPEDRHAVVMKSGQLVHDPNPLTEPEWFSGEKEVVCHLLWIVPYAQYYWVDPSDLERERTARVKADADSLWQKYLAAKTKPEPAQLDAQADEKTEPTGTGAIV